MHTYPWLSFAALLAAALPAQGNLSWKAGTAAPGPVGNHVGQAAAWWDPDGPGPRGRVLVVGGSFELPSIGARNLMFWDPALRTWNRFADQPDQAISAVVVLTDGRLVVGGQFTSMGTVPANRVAVFDGATWSSPGGGVGGSVLALQEMPNGDLVVGGSFTTAGGAPIVAIARWDGIQWHALGVHTITATRAIALRPNGNLVVTGLFPVGVAEWNGSGWATLSAGLTSSLFDRLLVLPNDDVIAAGPIGGIWRWDGALWASLSVGHLGGPSALLPLGGASFLAGSIGSVNGTTVDGLMQWDGTQWTAVAAGTGYTTAIVPDTNGDLFLVGNLKSPPGEAVRTVGRWDGTALRALSRGFDAAIDWLLPTPTGEVMALGSFTAAAGTPVTGAALRSGDSWTAIPPPGPGPIVSTVDSAGTIWAATDSTGQPAGNVFRWMGTGWQAMGTSIRSVSALSVTPAHGITVGCAGPYSNEPRIARWNGAQWVQYGAGLDWAVRSVLVRASGELVAGGEFLYSGTTAVSRIARWNAAAWQPFDHGFDGPVRALAELPDGDLIAAGDFQNTGDFTQELNLIARWDGTTWQPLGEGLAGSPGASVRALLVLPDGGLLVAGAFDYAGGAPAPNLARWDGTEWHAVDGGTDGKVRTLALTSNGDVLVGGEFGTAGGQPSAHFALLRSIRPATVVTYGVGCSGVLGPLVLEPAGLPWLGGTWRSTCYGVADAEIGIDLYGLAALQTPLSVLHPSAVGCDLLTLPLAVQLRLPQNGTLVSSFAVPGDPSLIETPVFQQMLVAELDASLGFTHMAASNGLELRLGSY